MKQLGRELELKFALTGDQFNRAKSLLAKMKLAKGQGVTQTLRSTYFDTQDCILNRNGFSLRLRQSGSGTSQTLKAETGVRGGVSHPIEFETPWQGRAPNLSLIADKETRKRLKNLVGKSRLRPVFETIIERTTQQLVTPEGDIVELALDKGTVKTATASRKVNEAELELKAGNASALLRAVQVLFADHVPAPSEQSKSDLGYSLLNPQAQNPLEPRRSSLPKLKRGNDCSSALAVILQSAVDQVLHNWSVVLVSDNPEGVHQLRIGLRRLRTALKAFKPAIRKDSLLDINDKLRDLARLAGELRDADVLALDIVNPLREQRDKDISLKPLLEILAKHRHETRLRVRHRLTSQELLALRLHISLLPALVGQPASSELEANAAMPVFGLSRKALKKMWRKVARQAQRIEQMNVEERHALRRDLKALRYAIEFFSDLYPQRKVERFTSKLEKLQDLFGYANDVVGARRLAHLPSGNGAPDSETHHAIGYVIGWHTARAEDAWGDVRTIWKKLEATPSFGAW